MSLFSKDRARRGYSGESEENFASLIGDSKQPNDTVEKFRIGPLSIDPSDTYYQSKEGRIFFFPNTWPPLAGFERALSEYYESMNYLSKLLLRILEIGFELKENMFLNKMTRHTSILSMNHYRSLASGPQYIPDDNARLDKTSQVETAIDEECHSHSSSVQMQRVAAHKDVSMLTIVSQRTLACDGGVAYDLQHAESELQLWVPNRCTSTAQSKASTEASADIDCDKNDALSWSPINTSKDDFVVHIGDCLEDWSGGILRSTLHRVVSNMSPEKPSSEYDRYSMAYFVTPNHDADVSSFQYEGENSKESEEKTLSYAQWRKQHIRKAVKIQQKNLS